MKQAKFDFLALYKRLTEPEMKGAVIRLLTIQVDNATQLQSLIEDGCLHCFISKISSTLHATLEQGPISQAFNQLLRKILKGT